MVPWNAAYQRLHNSGEIEKVFRRKIPPAAFRYRVYAVKFSSDVAGVTKKQGAILAASAVAGTYGEPSGPVLQTFPSGAVILGITASALLPQNAVFEYGNSASKGRRDLFGLNFTCTDNRVVTSPGMTLAATLLSEGNEMGIFPAKEIALYPNAGILCAAASLVTTATLAVTVAYHCMIPRDAV